METIAHAGEHSLSHHCRRCLRLVAMPVGFVTAASLLVALPLMWLNLDLFITHVFVEDAFYYLVPALKYHTHGVIGLDGRTWTNGYHPLWMLTNLALTFATRDKHVLPYLVSLTGWGAAVAAFLLLILLRIRTSSPHAEKEPIFPLTLASVWLLGPMFYLWLNGMESAIALLCMATILVLTPAERKPWSSIRWGLCLGLMVLARIDFLLLAVMLWITLVAWYLSHMTFRTTALHGSLTGCSLCLVILPYFLTNLLFFGGAETSSAAAKLFYANHVGDVGIANMPANLYAFMSNLFCALLGDQAPSLSRTLIGWALASLVGYGIWTKFCDASNHKSLGSWLEIVVYLFPLIHSTAYAYALGHFARDAYINWYFVPCVFVIGYLAACAASDLARLHTGMAAPLVLLVSLPLIGCGLGRVVTIIRYSHVSPFVALGHTVNRVTPVGSRIAAFSAGTQAFLATDDRSVTNIDGLISSRQFIEDYLVPGRISAYLRSECIGYFSDHAGDLQVSSLQWPSSQGNSVVIPQAHMAVVAQGPSWSTGFLNIVQLLGNEDAHAGPQLVSHMSGTELGKVYVTSLSDGSQEEMASTLVVNAEAATLTLPNLIGKEVSNAFSFVVLEPGWYKVAIEADLSCDAVAHSESLVRASFASWADSATWAETVFDRERLGPDGHVRLVLFGRLERRTDSAEVRIATLGNGASLCVHTVDIFRIQDVVTK